MLAGEVVAVEVNEARARELEENVGAARRGERPGRPRRRPRPAGGADRLRPRARRRAVLGARRPRCAARPPLALAAAARAPARAAAGGGRARPPRRHDRLLRLHVNARRGRGGRRRLRARGRRDARGRLAAVPPPRPPGVPADAAARPRHERLLHRPAPRGCRRIARVGWGDWIRTARDRAVALRGGLQAARRADRVLLAAGCRVFHFDVGDGHFVPPVTIGPVVLRSIAPRSTRPAA